MVIQETLSPNLDLIYQHCVTKMINLKAQLKSIIYIYIYMININFFSKKLGASPYNRNIYVVENKVIHNKLKRKKLATIYM